TPERSDGHGVDPALLELVEGRGRLGSTDRLGVYTEMYWARLLDVLRDDFPRVAAVLGGDRFTALAGAYLERHPSTDPSVRWVGANFADFLAEWGPVDDLPFLERGVTPGTGDRDVLRRLALLEHEPRGR